MFKGHPKGLLAAALSNMGERFGYYIMNAVLVLFLCSKFGLADDKAGIIYSVFYCGIYVLSLVGGIIADRTANYKGTIQKGLITMAIGYAVLSVPILATPENKTWLLCLTCVALFLIAFGNGLFKGNLQAIVGQMYDNLEADAAKEGPEALKAAQDKRDSGFQIFYVFINIVLDPSNLDSITAFCTSYLDHFNTGVHYSFIASVAAMLISLLIFILTKQRFPNPGKKEAVVSVEYTAEEKQAMAKEIKQRMYALFAVLGVVVFFWFSFHQNGQSLSMFARDFVNTSKIAPEIWQAVNPFFVIVLTPVIMWFFSFLAGRGRQISTPRKIAYGMGIAALAYLFLSIFSFKMGYPSSNTFLALDSATQASMKAGPWVLIVTYFFLTVAELFISPLGLSFVSKVAPKSMQGLCQGLWLGATAVGNLFLFLGPKMYNVMPLGWCWGVFLVLCLISMGVMFGMVTWLEKVTNS